MARCKAFYSSDYTQVQHFEPAKWVAKLRAMKTDNHILLLHTNMEFGHGGASGRFDYLKDVVLNYAYLFALERDQPIKIKRD